VKDNILNVTSRLATQCGELPFADKIYWELEKAYCQAQIASLGDEWDAQVADTTVRFVVSTKGEYQRVKDLGGERAVIKALLVELSGTETVWDISIHQLSTPALCDLV
jgi:hypothetical protein